MNELKERAITTLEVAEMMGTRHSDVLEKLEGSKRVKGIIPVLTERKIPLSDYFQESTYKDSSGKENRCYKVTKLGCDFLANKFNGEKGILFTAKYVKRFNEMEEQILKPLSELEILQRSVILLNMQDVRITKLEDNMTIDHGQAQDLRQAGAKRVLSLCGGKQSEAYRELSKKMFSELWHDFKEYFRINSYSNTLVSRFDEAMRYVDQWTPSNNTLISIRNCNSQMDLAI